ncbi:ParB N-terminal domain-containing protein, partial [Staphylococcus aureus]|uniref:ParB N-terminal domain-containing protein n=1 Tax=Staphylococcus aureus TaxID=1280 RepID=UPI0021B1B7D1
MSHIKPNPYHPPKTFHQNHLNHFPHSINQYPIFQPILLTKTVQRYYIVLGE